MRIDKHNERDPARRVLFLNYSAVDPVLTNERCSFWHFRFDAHADMRLAALTDVLQGRRSAEARLPDRAGLQLRPAGAARVARQLGAKRPDIQIVGDELHPLGRVKDFLPYASKIMASGAQAVLTGNWGNDLTLLVKAAREAGVNGKLLHLLRQCARRAGRHRRRRRRPRARGGRLAAERADAASRTPSTRPSARAFRSRATTTCTCACSC